MHNPLRPCALGEVASVLFNSMKIGKAVSVYLSTVICNGI